MVNLHDQWWRCLLNEEILKVYQSNHYFELTFSYQYRDPDVVLLALKYQTTRVNISAAHCNFKRKHQTWCTFSIRRRYSLTGPTGRISIFSHFSCVAVGFYQRIACKSHDYCVFWMTITWLSRLSHDFWRLSHDYRDYCMTFDDYRMTIATIAWLLRLSHDYRAC